MRPTILQYNHFHGSVTTKTVTVTERLSFDAWGRRRNADTWSYTAVPNSFTFDRGYTLHEHLDAYQLINMNGRVYDPLLGRFLSPDPYIQMPDFTQNLNRYSYCLNNPLMYTDPSGEFITWNIGNGGFSIGFNLTPIGIPLGAGINVGWGNGASLGAYGEVGYRVGGTGLGAGVAAQQSIGYNFKHENWSTTTTELAYASFGPLTVGGNLSQAYDITNDQRSHGWGVNAGLGIGNEKGSIGFNVGYGSGGWTYGLGGSYYTSYERAYMRAEARNKQNIYNAIERNLNGSGGVGLYGAYHGMPNIGFFKPGKYVGFYGNAPVYEHSLFNDGSAITTPPDGIWVGDGVYNSTLDYNRSLMAHEYGHWIQYEQKGFAYYYGVIAPASLYYAARQNLYGWCELGASNNGYNYKNQPIWWDFTHFPLE